MVLLKYTSIRLRNCKAVLPRCTVGSRQAEYELQGVDGRGRYGNEVGNSLRRHKRETNR